MGQSGNLSVTGTSDATGSGTAVNTMPPYVSVIYIIKT
jgi:hypothetical protein